MKPTELTLIRRFGGRCQALLSHARRNVHGYHLWLAGSPKNPPRYSAHGYLVPKLP
jgi:hypothetical protein